MRVDGRPLRTLWPTPARDALQVIDQRLLPTPIRPTEDGPAGVRGGQSRAKGGACARCQIEHPVPRRSATQGNDIHPGRQTDARFEADLRFPTVGVTRVASIDGVEQRLHGVT